MRLAAGGSARGGVGLSGARGGLAPSVLQVCYATLVPNSVTSSFRISETLRLRLEATARHLGKRKNWVINRALEEYLAKAHHRSLSKEARRQSLLASRVTSADERFWGRQAATDDWK